MQTFTNDIDMLFKKPPPAELEWTGTPEIKFSVEAGRTVATGDRIRMGNTLTGSGVATVYYEITEIISILPNTRLSTTQDVIANAKRILL